MPSVDITEAELKKTVAEIAALTRPATLGPGEVTAAMLAEEAEITNREAYDRLEKGFREKIFKKRKVKVGSHWPGAYSIIATVMESVTDCDDFDF